MGTVDENKSKYMQNTTQTSSKLKIKCLFMKKYTELD